MVLRSLAVALNVLTLSERILLGNPCLAENHFRARMKVGVDISRTRSRWIARVIQQVKLKQTNPYFVDFPALLPSNIHGPCKVNSRICEWWCLSDSEGRKRRGWRGAEVLSFEALTYYTFVDHSSYETSPLDYPVLSSNFTECLLHYTGPKFNQRIL